jgi:hypothetical protein
METPLQGLRVAPNEMISSLLGVLNFSYLENQSHREAEAEGCGSQCL